MTKRTQSVSKSGISIIHNKSMSDRFLFGVSNAINNNNHTSMLHRIVICLYDGFDLDNKAKRAFLSFFV